MSAINCLYVYTAEIVNINCIYMYMHVYVMKLFHVVRLFQHKLLILYDYSLFLSTLPNYNCTRKTRFTVIFIICKFVCLRNDQISICSCRCYLAYVGQSITYLILYVAVTMCCTAVLLYI